MSTFLTDNSGASLVEYGLLLGLIAIAAVAAVEAVGISIQNLFQKIANELENVENRVESASSV